MMRTMKCMKLDFTKSMGMVKFLAFFLLVAGAAVAFSADATPSFAALYMIFGVICVCSNNFFQTGSAEISTLVLPVTAANRVFGRYLYGIIFVTVSALAGFLITMVTMILRKYPADAQTAEVALIMAYLGVGYMVVAFQFAFLYLTRMKNAQILSLVRMVPAFVMFFGLNALTDKIRENADSGISLKLLQDIITWCLEHSIWFSTMLIAAGLVVILICAVISWVSEKKRY